MTTHPVMDPAHVTPREQTLIDELAGVRTECVRLAQMVEQRNQMLGLLQPMWGELFVSPGGDQVMVAPFPSEDEATAYVDETTFAGLGTSHGRVPVMTPGQFTKAMIEDPWQGTPRVDEIARRTARGYLPNVVMS